MFSHPINHWARKICPTIAVGLLLFQAACNFSDAPQPGQWIARRSMLIKRSWISMAVVHEKIYGIGGMTDADGRRLDLNEVFDPRANEWTQLAPMPTPRSSPGTAVIGDLIYVVGGYPEEDATNQVEVFDTANNRWLTDLPPMPTARFDLTAVAIDNLVYAIGGYNRGALDVFEAYDTQARQWTKLAPMPTARYALQALVIGGKIFAIGGRTATYATDVIEVFDPKTGQWSTSPMRVPEPIAGFGATMVEGNLHVVKYDKHFAYDFKTGKWRTDLPPMPTSRHGLRLAYIDGLLYAIGGCLPDGNSLFDVARNEAYIVRPPTQTKIK